MSPSGLVVFLTGALGGIGRATVELLLQDGYKIYATDIQGDALVAYARDHNWPTDRSVCATMDVSDPSAWSQEFSRAIQRFGRVDILMNIAGYLRPSLVTKATAEELQKHLAVNFSGVALGTITAARHMVAQQVGHIINIASMAALVPVPGLSLYSASKYAVRAFSLAAAQELRAAHVFVTVVCPNPVETPMLKLQENYPEAAMTFTARKILTPEVLAKILVRKVLRKKPMLLVVPKCRGWLARLGDLFPRLFSHLSPLMIRQGLAIQAKRKKPE